MNENGVFLVIGIVAGIFVGVLIGSLAMNSGWERYVIRHKVATYDENSGRLVLLKNTPCGEGR